MAASASASLACATSAKTFPLKGSWTGVWFSPWRHWPPMRNGRAPGNETLRGRMLTTSIRRKTQKLAPHSPPALRPWPWQPSLPCPNRQWPRSRTLHTSRPHDNLGNLASAPCDKKLQKDRTCTPRTPAHLRDGEQARMIVYQTYGNPRNERK